MTQPRVVHLSSHHQPVDNRIFQRECRTLADAGYDVAFVVRSPADETRDGVRILAVKAPRSRLERVTVTAFNVFRRGLAAKGSVYHFHDPELIPWGFMLRALGKTVIFDVHEDFAQAADVRGWIPRPLRPLVGGFYSAMARLAARLFHIVIAERYYARTFPQSTPVLNYPHLERSAALRAVDRRAAEPDRIRLLYVGSVTPNRGAGLHAALATKLPGCLIHFSGHTPPSTARTIFEASGDATIGILAEDGTMTWEKRSNRPEAEVSTIILEGVGYYVADKMLETFSQPWTAGLSIFPFSEHYYEKELTKFFEYMAAGVPLLVSDFPNWRAIVDGARCGFAVDPADVDGAAEKIRWLHEHREERLAMGERGRKAVEERYSWSSQQNNLRQLYARIAGEPRGAALAVS